MGIVETFRSEGAAIVSAPWSFALCVLAGTAVVALGFRWRYARIVEALKAQLALRDDQLKFQITATPAAKRLERGALKSWAKIPRLTVLQWAMLIEGWDATHPNVDAAGVYARAKHLKEEGRHGRLAPRLANGVGFGSEIYREELKEWFEKDGPERPPILFDAP